MAEASQTSFKNKKLYRSTDDKKWLGVCGGMAEYFGVDSTAVRVAWVLGTILTGFVPGLLAYVIVAIVTPKKPKTTEVK